MHRFILPLVLGVLMVVAAGLFGYSQYQARRGLETLLGNKYQQAFYDFIGQVQSLEVLFAKSMVAADPRQNGALFMDIRQQASAAQASLVQLPLSDITVTRTVKFLNQAGDYADSLARKTKEGRAVDAGDWETLDSLYRQAGDLNRELQGIQAVMTTDGSFLRDLVREAGRKLRKPPVEPARSDFKALDRQMQHYPALIYDGPFSEHLELREPRGLSGLAEITKEEAGRIALEFLDKRPDITYQVRVAGTNEGTIPAYRVELAPEGEPGTGEVIMDVSRRGGKVTWLISSRLTGEVTLDIEQAKTKAGRFLQERGYKNMQATYFLRHGDAVTFNFAATQDGAVIYPDLVKVTVALDNGETTGVEATGYLMSHQKRALPKPKLTLKQARALLNPRLAAEGGRLAVIPTGPAGEEKLTYEFKGKLGDDTYLVYINALNGREEKILKLIETPAGTLTM